MTVVARNGPHVPERCVPLKGNRWCWGEDGPSLPGCVRPPAPLSRLTGFVSAAQDAPEPDQRLRYDRTQGFLPPPGLCLHAQQLTATQVCRHPPPAHPSAGCAVGRTPRSPRWPLSAAPVPSPLSLQEQLRRLYPRLKVLAFGAKPETALHTYFPSFLSRATPSCPPGMKKEVSPESGGAWLPAPRAGPAGPPVPVCHCVARSSPGVPVRRDSRAGPVPSQNEQSNDLGQQLFSQ